MTAKTKKFIGLGVAGAYVLAFLGILISALCGSGIGWGLLIFGGLSFAAGALTLYFYENGKLVDAIEEAKAATKKVTSKKKTTTTEEKAE